MDCSLPGSSVHGILPGRILEWIATSCSRGSSRLRGWTRVSCLLHQQAGSLPLVLPWWWCYVTKSRLTLCNPMDCSMPGFPVLHCLLEFAKTHVHWVSDTTFWWPWALGWHLCCDLGLSGSVLAHLHPGSVSLGSHLIWSPLTLSSWGHTPTFSPRSCVPGARSGLESRLDP